MQEITHIERWRQPHSAEILGGADRARRFHFNLPTTWPLHWPCQCRTVYSHPNQLVDALFNSSATRDIPGSSAQHAQKATITARSDTTPRTFTLYRLIGFSTHPVPDPT